MSHAECHRLVFRPCVIISSQRNNDISQICKATIHTVSCQWLKTGQKSCLCFFSRSQVYKGVVHTQICHVRSLKSDYFYSSLLGLTLRSQLIRIKNSFIKYLLRIVVGLTAFLCSNSCLFTHQADIEQQYHSEIIHSRHLMNVECK